MSLGAIGGILCCWEKDIYVALECVSENRFVAVKGQWVDSSGLVGLECVYAPTNRLERLGFLDNLVQFIGQ